MMIRNLLIYFIKGSEKDLTWSVVIPRRKKKKEKENSYRKLPCTLSVGGKFGLDIITQLPEIEEWVQWSGGKVIPTVVSSHW